MLELFQNGNRCECLRHGRFSYTYITRNVSVDTPELEVCSQLCFFQHSNFVVQSHQSQISVNKANLTDCTAFAYDVQTRVCSLISQISQSDFNDKINFDGDNKFSLSGLHDCQVLNFFNHKPKTYVKNNLVEMKQLCSFSPVNLVFQTHLSRCKNLFFRLLYPIQNQKNVMELFMHNFLKAYEVKQGKGKRSIAGSVLKAGKLLLSAANSVESSVLLGTVASVTKSSMSLLENFDVKIQSSGLKSRVIKAQSGMSESINIEKFLEAAESYQQNFDELDKIRMNANIFIEQLLSTNNQLQKYYRFLVENEQPMENKTAEFINGQSHIFLAYVRQNRNTCTRFCELKLVI